MKTKAISKATVSAPAKLPIKTTPQLRRMPPHGDARTLVEPGQRRQDEDAGEQVEAEQVKHAEADREEDRADQRLAGLTVTVTAKTAASARMAPAM